MDPNWLPAEGRIPKQKRTSLVLIYEGKNENSIISKSNMKFNDGFFT